MRALTMDEVGSASGMRELTVEEIEMVGGGRIRADWRLEGLLAGILGSGIAIAGLGTPISIAGAALAIEGATLAGLGMIN